tara:strand:- start:129 stop:350 length:222 start_codon:yes stop_codon:yes gene_type:complete
MNSYFDMLSTDCMEIVLEERVYSIENEISKIKTDIIKKLDNDYKIEKNKTPGKFNIKALRAAVNLNIYSRELK